MSIFEIVVYVLLTITALTIGVGAVLELVRMSVEVYKSRRLQGRKSNSSK